MLDQTRRIILNAPLQLVHLVGGTGAAALAFLLTFNWYDTWVTLPIMFVCLLPDSLYSASCLIEFRAGHISLNELCTRLQKAWVLMAGACVAIVFAGWLGTRLSVLNTVFGGA